MQTQLPIAESLGIREARDEDLPELLQLYREAGIDSGETLSLQEAGALFAKIRSYPNYKIYLACSSKRIEGCFSLLIMDNLGHCGAPAGTIEAVAVHPDSQGRGIGRYMMGFARERCREAGCYKMALSSNVKRTNAHAFYETLGFTRHGYSFLVEP